MRYYWLASEDEPNVNWILFRADPKRRLRERYKSLACPACGRVDELEALRLGFDSDVRVRSRFDFFTTDDGYVCVNKRGRRIIEESGASGLQFLPLPRGQYFVPVPTHRVPVKRERIAVREEEQMDLEAVARDPRLIETAKTLVRVEIDSCGMEFHGKCDTCGRYCESTFWPRLGSMTLPEDVSLIITPDVLHEGGWSSETWLMASEQIVEALQRAGLRGLEPLEAT